MKKFEEIKKWIVEEASGINIFEERFDTKEEALKVANEIWEKWSRQQKKNNRLGVYFLDGIEHLENGETERISRSEDLLRVYELGVEYRDKSKDDHIKELLEYEDLTEKEIEHVLEEMKDIDILDDETFIIKSTGMTGGKNQEVIYEVLLINGDKERFVCYI